MDSKSNYSRVNPHYNFTFSMWQAEVAAGDCQRGYCEWVEANLEQARSEAVALVEAEPVAVEPVAVEPVAVEPFTGPTFHFMGYDFMGVRQLTAAERAERGPESAWMNCCHQLPRITSRPVLRDRDAGWNWEEFYEAARGAGAGKLDLFYVQGYGRTLYLPAKNHLFILPDRV